MGRVVPYDGCETHSGIQRDRNIKHPSLCISGLLEKCCVGFSVSHS